MPRPDFSEYVVHFTKARAPHAAERDDAPDGLTEIAGLSARERLFRVLQERRLRATPMPYTGKPAVAFTECVWASLLEHAAEYSHFGVGFSKACLFRKGGGPVFYMRQDLFRAHARTGMARAG